MSLIDTLRIASRRWPLFGLYWLYRRGRVVLGSRAGIAEFIHKQSLIKECAHENGLQIFVETGTCLGDTLWTLKDNFSELYSIELDRLLYDAACKRFAKFGRIHLFCGDSAEVLPRLLDSILEPCLFWLDAHDSGGFTAAYAGKTPIWKELTCILTHHVKGHVVLIDDASYFGSDPAYPSVSELRQYCLDEVPEGIFEVRGDVIIFSMGG